MLQRNQIITYRADINSQILFIELIEMGESKTSYDDAGWIFAGEFSWHCLLNQKEIDEWFSSASVDSRYQIMVRVAWNAI